MHWTLGADGALASEEVGGAVIEGSLADFTLFPGFYLEVQGGRALFGYTGAYDPVKTPGGVVVVDLEEATTVVIDAPGNFDADFAGDGVLVNGLEVAEASEGQGLYLASWDEDGGAYGAAKVVAGLGASSGALERTGAGITLAGGYAGFGTTWPDGGEGSRVYALWSDDIDAADPASPLDAAVDGFELSIASEFTVFEPDSVVSIERDAAWEVTEIVLHSLVTGDDGEISSEEAQVLVTGPTFDGVAKLGTSELVILRHGAGYLIVDASGE